MKGVVFLDLLNPYKTQFCSVVNTEQHLWGISVGLVCGVLFVISPLWILLFFTVGFQMYPLVVLTCEESARLCQAQVRGRVCGGLMGTRLWMDHLGLEFVNLSMIHWRWGLLQPERWAGKKGPFSTFPWETENWNKRNFTNLWKDDDDWWLKQEWIMSWKLWFMKTFLHHSLVEW